MLMHLPIVVLATLPFTHVADSMPKFDIARECRAEGGPQLAQQKCAEDETRARDLLQPQWVQFAAGDKNVCIQETSMDGTPSYVALQICLEMTRDAKQAEK